MDNPNCIMFEMKVLNDIRKMNPEQRKEILSSIEREEEQEQEALKKNPNLHLERQMKQVIAELKELRQELQQKNFCSCPYATTKVNSFDSIDTIENTTKTLDSYDTLDDYDSCSLFSFDWLPLWIFLILLFVSLLAPSKQSTIIRPFSI